MDGNTFTYSTYTARPKKRRTLAFCFDYRAHLLWHCFDKLMQCHNIYFHPESQYFLAEILYWWQESQTIPFPLIPNTFNGVKVRTLCWPIHVWKWLLMLHCFTARARWILALLSWNMPELSGKKKSNWQDNLFIQYIQELCWLVGPRPDQLKQPQIIIKRTTIFLNGQCIW